MNNLKPIDCVLLRFQRMHYLLPQSVIKEVFLLKMAKDGYTTNIDHEIILTYENQKIPLELFNGKKLYEHQLHPRTKVAIIYRFKSNHKYFIAFPFEGSPHKTILKPNDLLWFDEPQQIAMLGSCQESALKVMIPKLLS